MSILDPTLRLQPLSVNFFYEARKEEDGTHQRRAIGFDVVPYEHECLEFETGEIFRNPNYSARHQGEPVVLGYLRILHGTDEDAWHESLIGFSPAYKSESNPENESDARIDITICLGESKFDEVLNCIRAGVYPNAITVSFAGENVIEFGWEPDGSRQIWKNENEDHSALQVTGLEVSYPVVSKTSDISGDEEFEELLSNKSDIQFRYLTKRLDTLTDSIVTIQKIAFVGVIAVCAIAGILLL